MVIFSSLLEVHRKVVVMVFYTWRVLEVLMEVERNSPFCCLVEVPFFQTMVVIKLRCLPGQSTEFSCGTNISVLVKII